MWLSDCLSLSLYIYIYNLFERERASEREGAWGGAEAGSPLSREPHGELHPWTPRSRPELKADVNQLSPPNAPSQYIFKIHLFLSDLRCSLYQILSSHVHWFISGLSVLFCSTSLSIDVMMPFSLNTEACWGLNIWKVNASLTLLFKDFSRYSCCLFSMWTLKWMCLDSDYVHLKIFLC